MAHPIRFEKDSAERWQEALKSGGPIEPPPAAGTGWTC
jgi:hypothetical protein